jgi:hypothetical protein
VRQVSFADHSICPSDVLRARYGLSFPAAPTPKRVKVDSSIAPSESAGNAVPLLPSALIGYNLFDRRSWGTEAEWQLISAKVDAMLVPFDSKSKTTEPPSLAGTDTSSAFLRAKIASHVLRGVGFADSPCYILPFQASNSAIILTSAVDVFEVFRRDWYLLDMASLAEKLCERAISFMPAVEGDPVGPQTSELGNGLGYRPPNYKPTPGDVLVYRSLTIDFLLSPRGQLALFYGGIITRMALDYIDLDAGSLLSNSSEFSYSVKAGGKTYSFDMLSVDEVEKLCGVYYVNTGVLFTVMSWIPCCSY